MDFPEHPLLVGVHRGATRVTKFEILRPKATSGTMLVYTLIKSMHLFHTFRRYLSVLSLFGFLIDACTI